MVRAAAADCHLGTVYGLGPNKHHLNRSCDMYRRSFRGGLVRAPYGMIDTKPCRSDYPGTGLSQSLQCSMLQVCEILAAR